MPDGSYRVYLGKGKYVQRSTQLAIDAVIQQHKLKHENRGKELAALNAGTVAGWKSLSERCEIAGTTLEAAVDHWLPVWLARQASRPLWDAIDDYLAEASKRLKPPTLRDHRTKLFPFRDSFPSPKAVLVSDTLGQVDVVRKYLDGVMERTSARHHKNTRAVLSAFSSWLKRRGLLAENPCELIETYTRGVVTETRVLEPGEARELLRIAAENAPADILAYFTISLFAGLRPHEFVAESRERFHFLDWKDVDTHQGVLVSGALSKTSRRRRVTANSNIKSILSAWVDLIRSREGILEGNVCGNTGFYQRLKKWKQKHLPEEFPRIEGDVLRHSFGTFAVAGGASTGDVAKWMGNSEAMVRAHYLDAGRTPAEAAAYWSLTPDILGLAKTANIDRVQTRPASAVLRRSSEGLAAG